MATNGLLNFNGTNKATFVGANSNIVLDTVNSSLGIGITGTDAPSSNLYITGNAYVSSDLTVSTNTLHVDTTNSRVGVGIVSPQAPLHIGDYTSGSAGELLRLSGASSSDRHFKFLNEDDGVIGGAGANAIWVHDINSSFGQYAFRTNNTELMRITNSGNVGIGTTSPVAKFNIQGTSEGAPPTSGGEGTSNGIFRLRDNFNVALDIGTLGASPWTTWLQVADTTTMGSEYPLSLNPNGGNVGIGTTSPDERLHVVGNIKHEGLTMSSGTDVDQLITIPMTLSFDGSSWYTVTSGSSHLAGGTWIVKVYIHSAGGNGSGQLYDETYSGMFTWYSAGTNSTVVNDIALHNAGHAPNAEVISMRTRRTGTGGVNLILEINSNMNWGGTTRATSFLCRRLL